MARTVNPSRLRSKLSVKRPTLSRLPNPNEPDAFEEMTLLEHMEELRERIVKTCIAVGIAFVGGLLLSRSLLEQIARQSGVTKFDPDGPMDALTIYMKVALYIALSIALPVVVYQFFGFLAPGLTKKEKRILLTSLPFVAVLFVVGALYAFLEAAPRALAFLKVFGFDYITWDIHGDETINFYLTLMVGLGLAFQLPVVMFLLAKLNIVGPTLMRRYRKYAVLGILVVSAIITPTTDPISLSLVAVPLYALYEAGILVSVLFARGGKDATRQTVFDMVVWAVFLESVRRRSAAAGPARFGKVGSQSRLAV